MPQASNIGSTGFGPLPVSTGSGGGGGGGTDQKQPNTYIVGTTANAPAADQSAWTLAAFANSYLILFINGIPIPTVNPGSGPYLTKTLSSSTATLTNYTYQTDDVLIYILITPNP